MFQGDRACWPLTSGAGPGLEVPPRWPWTQTCSQPAGLLDPARAGWGLCWGRRVPPAWHLVGAGTQCQSCPRWSVHRCGRWGRRDSHLGQLAPREWSPWSENEAWPSRSRPHRPAGAPPSWPSAGLSPQLLAPCSLRVPWLGPSGALLLSPWVDRPASIPRRGTVCVFH